MLFLFVPEILDTKETFDKINQMIKTTKSYMYLVCPYFDGALKLPFKNLSHHIDINMIFGKNEDQIDRLINYVADYDLNFSIYFHDNLHSKIYLNENFAIISSLNLLKYSVENNHEISVLFDRSKHPKQWDKIYQQIKVIKKDAYKNF